MRLILTSLAALALAGQTAIQTRQMRGNPGSAWRLIAVAPDGSFRQIDLGPGLVILNGAITITSPLTPLAQRLIVGAGGAYALPPWAATITRNGLMMEEGEDYIIAGRALTPRTAWTDTDLIVARGCSAP